MRVCVRASVHSLNTLSSVLSRKAYAILSMIPF